MNDVNLETIADAQSWYKIQPLNEFNLIRAKQKNPQETEKSWRKFVEPSEKPKVIHTDNSLEFGKSCEDLSWNYSTSTPIDPRQMVLRVFPSIKEGTSAARLQSGLDEKWWADSMECYCCLRNVYDLLED